VLFPDERVYTLKAETIEDVDEWKDALERALEAAPNAALVAGQHTTFCHNSYDLFEGSAEHSDPDSNYDRSVWQTKSSFPSIAYR
jgi:N-acetylneuraminic acid mutarotase